MQTWILDNTPLISTVFNLIALFILFSGLPRKRLTAFCLLFMPVVFLIGYLLILQGYLMIPLIIWGICALKVCYEIDAWDNILYLSCLYMFMTKIGRLLCGGLFPLGSPYDIHVNLIAWPFRILLAFLLRGWIPVFARTKRTLPDYLFLIIALLQTLFLNYLSDQITDKGAIYNYTVSVICIGLFASLFSLLWRAQTAYKQQQLSQIEQSIQKQHELFEYKTAVDEAVARQYHDLHLQLMGLTTLTDDTQIQDAIREMCQFSSGYRDIYRTGNEMLDVLLNEKAMEAKEKEIRFDVFMDFTKGDFIHRTDLFSMVGNALNNAIEACEKISDPARRHILIKSAEISGFLIIKVENSFQGALSRQGRKLLTSKKDPLAHGKGLNSIQYSLNRYHGTCQIRTQEDLFILEMYIPLPSPQ